MGIEKMVIGDVWFNVEQEYYEKLKDSFDSVIALAVLLDFKVTKSFHNKSRCVIMHFDRGSENYTLFLECCGRMIVTRLSLYDKSDKCLSYHSIASKNYNCFKKLELLLN